jgi:hypothetical protein
LNRNGSACAIYAVHLKRRSKPGISAWDCIPFVLCLLSSSSAFSQEPYECRGFLQESARAFARKPNPSDTYTEAATHSQFWCRAGFKKNYSFRGTFDFRFDTHNNVDRRRWLDVDQRGIRRPAGAVSELYLDARLGRMDLRVGRQQIRWGRADGFNPTDNAVPYDYLDSLADERLAVPALKADVYFDRTSLEGVWVPFYTPTRLPILGQRWFPHLPREAQGFDLVYRDLGGPFPAATLGNGQWGLRYNQILSRGEFSFSYFDGFDDIPFFRSEAALLPGSARPTALISLRREYYRVRVAGLDFASGIGPIGIRGEAAYFDQSDPDNLDHVLYIVGVDKAWGEWFAVLQYAGQKANGRFAGQAVFPDLGLRSTLICRIERTMGPSRSLEIKGALSLHDGDLFLQPVYTVTLSNRWRLKVGAIVFAGEKDGYLGQFRDNSHINLELKYAF